MTSRTAQSDPSLPRPSLPQTVPLCHDPWISTNLMHNGVMTTNSKHVRQSVSLPVKVAAQVRRLARARRLSANRMLVELVENGIDAEKRRQQEFFALAERFRAASDPEEVRRLGDQIGRMVFGD
jgi:hypothetical protein